MLVYFVSQSTNPHSRLVDDGFKHLSWLPINFFFLKKRSAILILRQFGKQSRHVLRQRVGRSVTQLSRLKVETNEIFIIIFLFAYDFITDFYRI